MKPLFCAIVAVGSLPVAITAFAQSSFAPANAPDTNPTAAVPCRAASDLPANPRTGFRGHLCRRCHSALAGKSAIYREPTADIRHLGIARNAQTFPFMQLLRPRARSISNRNVGPEVPKRSASTKPRLISRGFLFGPSRLAVCFTC
jgi:hypothetical protein